MVKKILSFMIIFGLLVSSSWAYVNNDYARVTSVSHSWFDRSIGYAADGALAGMDSNDWADGDETVDPSISNMNNYFQNYEYVFFSGHGIDNAIGGNEANGFPYPDYHMYKTDIQGILDAKFVTLFSCYSLNGFGKELYYKGVDCVVGWKQSFLPSASEAEEWAEELYSCDGSESILDCVSLANYYSGLSGNAWEGSCNIDIGNGGSKSSSTSSTKYLSNGLIVKSEDMNFLEENSLEGIKLLSEKDSLNIAKSFLNLPKSYQLVELNEFGNNHYDIIFKRTHNNMLVNFDEYRALIDRTTGKVVLYKKTYTDNLSQTDFESSRETLEIPNEIIDKFDYEIISVENIIMYDDSKKPTLVIKAKYINEQGDESFIYINTQNGELL
ncbi:MAG: hypothetical protein ACQERZ_09745 [Fusobacteriota bacterium]